MKALVVRIASLFVVASSPAQGEPSLRVEREFFLPGGPCATLRYSPDGRWLAAGGPLGDVALLDAESGALHVRLEAVGARVGALRFSADGEMLAVCGQRLTLWRVRDGGFVASLPCASVSGFDWSRDGQRLAIVSAPGRVQVLRAADLGVERELVLDATPAPRIDALALDPLGQRLAVGVGRGELQVFDVRTGELRERLPCDGFARGLMWLDDGRLLRLGSGGSLAGLGGEAVVFAGSGMGLDAQPDGRRVLVQASGGVLRFDGDGLQQVLEGRGPAALHPDGVRWARWAGDALSLCEGDGAERSLPGPNRMQPGRAVLSGDGRWLVVRGHGEHRREQVVFEVATGRLVEVRGLPACGALLPDRQGLGVALLRGFGGLGDGDDGDPRIEFWRPGETARLERSVAVHAEHAGTVRPSTMIELSADGSVLTLGRELVDLFDASRSFRSPLPLTQQVVVANDVLVSRFGHGGLSRVGEVVAHDRCGAELARVSSRDDAPLHLAVSPAGDRLLVCFHRDAELRSSAGLTLLQRLPWRWRRARWLDERHVLGEDLHALQIGDVATGVVCAALGIESHGGGGCTDFDPARGLAVVVAKDRVQLVRVAASAPQPHTPGYLVVKVDLDAKRDTDRGFLAAAAAAQQRHDAATFDWDGSDYDALAAELRLSEPENVLFVLRPEDLDVVRHRRILLLTSKLDDDWFMDCAFGYLTGADGDACERFWQRIEQRRERTDASRNWTALSVASMDKSLVYRDSLPALAEAAGYRGDHYYFGTTDPDRERVVAQALAATDTADVLHFSGNGDPEGIWLFPDQRNLERDKHWPYDPARVGEDPDGAMPRLLAERFAERAWRAPIVWSGTCHSGAVDRVFVEGDIVSTFGRTERVTVHRLPEGHSLALAWLDAGAAALLVPIAANHGMSASMEIDFALQHGASLGEAVKSSWDDVLLQAEGALVLDLPVEGEAQRRGGEHVMQAGGANRVLLGDPALRPFAATKHPTESVHVEPRDGGRGGVVTVAWRAGWHWRAWDMFGTDPGRDWRVLARVDAASLGLEDVTDSATLDVQVTATGDDGEAMPYTLQRCGIERHRGKVWLHLQANAPRGATERKAATVRFEVGVQ